MSIYIIGRLFEITYIHVNVYVLEYVVYANISLYRLWHAIIEQLINMAVLNTLFWLVIIQSKGVHWERGNLRLGVGLRL